MKTIKFHFLLAIILLNLGLFSCSGDEYITDDPNGNGKEENGGDNNSASNVLSEEFKLVISGSSVLDMDIEVESTFKEAYIWYNNNDSVKFWSNQSLPFNKANKTHTYHIKANSLNRLKIHINGDAENIKLDFDNCSKLKEFEFLIINSDRDKYKTEIDVNLTNLKDSLERLNLDFGKNYRIYKKLDISNFKRLRKLTVASNNITELNASNCPYLNELDFRQSFSRPSRITSIDLSNCSSLLRFNTKMDSLRTLNLSGCVNLSSLDFRGNFINLTALDVSDCISLRSLECSYSKLTSLKLKGCANLHTLACENNKLSTLDLQGLYKLVTLNCLSNQLKAIDISNCHYLTNLNCKDNELGVDALNSLFGGLNSLENTWQYISIWDNPGEEKCNKSIATNKGWIFR